MLNRLNEVIYRGYRVNVNQLTFDLPEDNKSARCKKARFKRTGVISVYKFDKVVKRDNRLVKDLFPFLEDVAGLKTMCDYVLFYPKGDNIYAILCNLKSSTSSNNASQLHSSKAFVDFNTALTKRLFPDECHGVKVVHKLVFFSYKQIYKKPTRLAPVSELKLHSYQSNETLTEVCNLDHICN